MCEKFSSQIQDEVLCLQTLQWRSLGDSQIRTLFARLGGRRPRLDDILEKWRPSALPKYGWEEEEHLAFRGRVEQVYTTEQQ